MATDIPLMMQTTYAELLERARADAFAGDFAGDGVFVPKSTRGRVYWYFQASATNGRGQKYVGPETTELLERIAAHKAAKTYQKDQRALVAMLTRVANLPAPRRDIGELIAAMAAAGVFRLRGVLVGTVAYQTYPALLGVRLSSALVQTSDVDVAQFADVSAAVGDRTTPIADILRNVDGSFRPVPRINSTRTVSFVSASGLRVDFLTPNRSRDTDEPRNLPAFGTDAQQLRFLDFLIRDPEPAVLLHGIGVLVWVPAPQRFALHKLIVARRRHEEGGKREKDLRQAGALFDALVERRPYELRAAWQEAFARGKTWRRLVGEGLGLLHPATRDKVLNLVGAPHSVVPNVGLRFVPGKEVFDDVRHSVRFYALRSGPRGQEGFSVFVTREALSSIAGTSRLDHDACLEAFRLNRPRIEDIARSKYLNQPVTDVGDLWMTLSDV